MNEPQLFNFEGNEVRTLLINDEPYFLGKDVAEILGYSNINKAVQVHVDYEDKKILTYKGSPKMGKALWNGNDYSNKTIINESGLYALIFGSKLDKAKRFKRWVTSEVLPTIRKHGAYATPQTIDDWLDNPDLMIKTLEKLKEEREGRLIAEQQVNELKPKATYYDLVLQNKSLISVTQIAKDYGKSARWLNAKLHDLGMQYKQGSTWLLYQKYADKGYTQSTTHIIDDNKSKLLTKWTQKGRLAIYELLKQHGILPLIELQEA